MVSLTRTFHPIGFGAFYTECHKTIDKEINGSAEISGW